MTIINSRKEYWPSRGSNQRPRVLKSATLPTEIWCSAEKTKKFLRMVSVYGPWLMLSHNNPCFPCNIAITNFLVSRTCEIRFHDAQYDRSHCTFVYIMTSSYAKIPLHSQVSMFWTLFSSPEHNVFKGSFQGGDVSVVRRASCVRASCVVNNFFKYLLLPNRWANLDQTWQECSLGGPLQKLFTEFDSIKNSGCHGNEMEFFKQLFKNILWNRWSDFEIISQECSLGDPFQKLFAKFWSVHKHGSGEWGLLAL